MTADEIRSFVVRHAAKYAASDATALAADYAEDGTVETLSTGTHQGRQEIEEYYSRWLQAFPALGYTVERVVAEDDRAAVFFLVSGTHEGSFLGFPSTGKVIKFHGVMLLRFKNGLIAHERFVYDFSSLLIKLGMVKVKLGWSPR